MKYVRTREELIEELAELAHDQWWSWSKSIAESGEEEISEERLARWELLWIPYEDLSEVEKEKDRYWARRSLELVERSYMSCS